MEIIPAADLDCCDDPNCAACARAIRRYLAAQAPPDDSGPADRYTAEDRRRRDADG